MTDLRDMQLIAALARHSHFARAAEECGISQPAFSARIRNLELEVGVPIVKRGNRFMGFTSEGQIVLKWARKLLADADGLRQEIEVAKGHLSGRLTIGVIPTVLVYAANITALMGDKYPGLKLEIRSSTSIEILRGLEDFSLDAGLTYLEGDLAAGFNVTPLYDERYVLLAPAGMASRTDGEIGWAEAADLPLCLLTPDMRNRRILNEVFASLGLSPTPVMETNAFTAAFAHVASGAAATIAPERLADSLPITADVVRLSLVEPTVEKPIGLVVLERDPMPPALAGLLDVLD